MSEWSGIFEDSWGDITKISTNDNRYFWIPNPTNGSPMPLMPMSDIAINKFLKPDEDIKASGKFGCDTWEVIISFTEIDTSTCELRIHVVITGKNGYLYEYDLNDGNDIFENDPIIYDHTESNLSLIAPFIGSCPGFHKHTTGGNHSDNPHLVNGGKDIKIMTESGKVFIIRETEIGEEGSDLETKFHPKNRAYADGKIGFYREKRVDDYNKLVKEAMIYGDCDKNDEKCISAYVSSHLVC